MDAKCWLARIFGEEFTFRVLQELWEIGLFDHIVIQVAQN